METRAELPFIGDQVVCLSHEPGRPQRNAIPRAATGATLAALEGVNSAALSPDGRTVVTTSNDPTAQLWDTQTGAALATLEGHTDRVLSAVFSSDGSHVLTASADHTARLWDAKTGDSLAILEGHTDEVLSAEFSPDGSRILTGSADQTARLWDAHPLSAADSVTYATISATRVLTPNERQELFLVDQTKPDVGSENENDSGLECDRLAGQPFDPQRHGSGTPFHEIDVDRAMLVCEKALDSAPAKQRYRYQLGRALQRSGKMDHAVALYREAAAAGYPAASSSLAEAYATGEGVGKDPAEALRLYRLAVVGGFSPAYHGIGQFYWSGDGVAPDHDEALRWFERGAEKGDPASHATLGALFERGDGVAHDLEKALFHHAIAAQLFTAAGFASEAAYETNRRSSLSRVLLPEAAVRVADRIMYWHPTP